MKLLNLIAATALSVALATSALAQATQQAPSRSTTPPPAASAPAKPSTAPSASGAQGSTAPQGGLVDINTASKEELDKLKGVGPARAEAIIQNRPYRAKTDLKTRKIIPDNVYNEIQDKIVARQGSAGTSSGSSAGAPSTSGGAAGGGKKQ